MPNFNYAQIIAKKQSCERYIDCYFIGASDVGAAQRSEHLISTGYPAEATANERPKQGTSQPGSLQTEQSNQLAP
jgi:hypothetical protein